MCAECKPELPVALLRAAPLQDGCDGADLIPGQSVTIGRKQTCGLLIKEAHAYVSGEHCILTALDATVTVHDSSANGTYVNGTRIGKGKSVVAKIGDEISLAKPTRQGGAIKFRVEEIVQLTSGSVQTVSPARPSAASTVPAQNVTPAVTSEALHGRLASIAARVPQVHVPTACPGSDGGQFRTTEVQPSASKASRIPAPSSVGPDRGQFTMTEVQPPASSIEMPSRMAVATVKHAPTKDCTEAALPPPPSAIPTGTCQGLRWQSIEALAPKPVPMASQTSRIAAAPQTTANSKCHSKVNSENTELASALAASRHSNLNEQTWLQARHEEEAAKVEVLSMELRAIRLEHEEVQEQHAVHSEAHARAGSTFALAEGNVRMSAECEELRQQLAQVQRESLMLKRACPAAEEEVVLERRKCAQLRLELEHEYARAERTEEEAAILQLEADETTSRTVQLRSEVETATMQNASLEQECAEAAEHALRASESVIQARQRLENRSQAFAALRHAVRDHARKVTERLSVLEQSLVDIPLSGDTPSLERTEVEAERHGLTCEPTAAMATCPPAVHMARRTKTDQKLDGNPVGEEGVDGQQRTKRRRVPQDAEGALTDPGERQALSSSDVPSTL